MESKYLELELFKQNHITWVMDHNEFNISYGKAQSKVLDFRSECVEQCKYIGHLATRPIAVLYSGGLDSEIICRSMHDAGVPFTALIFQDVNLLNSHETVYALEEAKKRNWRHRVIEFDLLHWLNEDVVALAEKLKISEPELCIYILRLKHAFELGFYPIDGRGDICLNVSAGEIVFSECEQSLKAVVYMNRLGIECCPKFFKFSPEIILSWLLDPMMVRWVNYHEAINLQSTKYYKAMIHVNNWHDLRSRKKYTGFENILREYRMLRDQLRSNNWVNRSQEKKYFSVINDLNGTV